MTVTRSSYNFTGTIRATVSNIDGSVSSVKDYYNTDTVYMQSTVAKWLTGITTTTASPPPTQIGAGTGSGTPSPTDTVLWSPLAGTQRECDSITPTQGYYAQYNTTYNPANGDPTGAYTEVGLFDVDNNMWAHAVINEYLSTGQTLTIQWMILVQADTTNQLCTVTNYMLVSIVNWLTGTSTTQSQIPPTQVELGTGSGTVTPSDTALWSPVTGTLANCDYLYVNTQYSTFFGHTYTQGAITGSFTECGLLDTSGNLWMHGVVTITVASNQVCSVLLSSGVTEENVSV